jgi:hypothetical protein
MEVSLNDVNRSVATPQQKIERSPSYISPVAGERREGVLAALLDNETLFRNMHSRKRL